MPTPNDLCLPAKTISRLHLKTPADLLTLIPRWLGFRPSPGDLAVLGAVEAAPAASVRLSLRYDLPGPTDTTVQAELVRHAIAVLRYNSYDVMAVVGYGPDGQVSPVIRLLRQKAKDHGIRLAEALRVQDERYWSYLCPNPDCCPREGTEFEMPQSLETLDGGPVLASRDELRGSLASATGKPGESMTAATRRAIRTRLRTEADAGLGAVRDAIVRYENGDCDLSFDEVARITVALRESDVRDDAWYRMTPEYREQHLGLWADITRLARPGHVAAPASLLAFTAWQCANGALANIALDRALADYTDFPMATALRRILDSGLPWSRVRHLVPPELAA